MSEALLLRVADLTVSAGTRLLVRDLTLALHSGEILAVLGRNGSGKSLLLHTLAGLRPAQSGQIELQGQSLADMARRDIAQRLGFLPQDAEPPPHVTVLEWVLGGRFAHGSEWRWPSAEDSSIAVQCLERVHLGGLAQRWLPTLSGGEQRRAAFATLLAQAPVVMLLDEPTNHLDPRQISAVMQIARDACAAGAAVIVTLHDPQLAARSADRALLLHGDGRWQLGVVADTLTPDALTELYDTLYDTVKINGRTLLLQSN